MQSRLSPITLLIIMGGKGRGEEEGGRLGEHDHRHHHHHHHDVHLAGFFPTSKGHHESRIGQGVMPAVKLALRDVNRSPDILPNIHLRLHWNNTAVSA